MREKTGRSSRCPFAGSEKKMTESGKIESESGGRPTDEASICGFSASANAASLFWRSGLLQPRLPDPRGSDFSQDQPAAPRNERRSSRLGGYKATSTENKLPLVTKRKASYILKRLEKKVCSAHHGALIRAAANGRASCEHFARRLPVQPAHPPAERAPTAAPPAQRR